MAVISSLGYKVTTGKTAFSALNAFLKKSSYDAYFILCDENTLQHCLPLLVTSCPALAAASLIEIESGEESKSLEFAASVLQTLVDEKAGRKALFINLGGGVVSDLGGFVASIYKRGIDFINIPTSLLAMADASVGGKTGIDFSGIKNIVGTFAQPKAVFAHPSFLSTLSNRHYKNGLAEVYKIALVSSKAFWRQLAAHPLGTEQLITESIRLKNAIVLKDPYDRSIRKSLNFGHTVGHALEILMLNTGHELLHGEAVVIGMYAESHLAFQKKLIGKATLAEITNGLRSVFGTLPLPVVPVAALLDKIRQDKKNENGKLLFALINDIGRGAIDVEVKPAQLEKAMNYYMQL